MQIKTTSLKGTMDLPGITAFKVISMLMVFLFHQNINLGLSVSQDFLDSSISVGATFMVAFIATSGFVLYIKYYQSNMLCNFVALKNFYSKRIKRIIPPYLLFLFVIYTFNLSFPDTVAKNIVMFPMEVTGIQAFFSKSFNILGNGGTWFITVILFLYFLFPLFSYIIKNMSNHALLVLFILLYFFCSYHSIFMAYFGGDFSSYYANPVMRIPEFVAGMITAKYYLIKKERKKLIKSTYAGMICILAFAVYLCGTAVLYNLHYFNNIVFEKNYTFYNFLVFPIFIVLIYCFACIRSGFFFRLFSLKIISFMGTISYCFYLTQTFSNRLLAYWRSVNIFDAILSTDKGILFLGFLLNLLFAILLYFVSKFISEKIFMKLNQKGTPI